MSSFPLEIETPRLLLRELQESDWEAVHDYAILETD